MKNRGLWVILAVALFLRGALLLAAVNHRDGVFTPDSDGYWELSTSIAEAGSFARQGQPEIFRTPGYPLFLAAIRPLGGWGAAITVQVFLDVVLVGLTFVLGRTVVGGRVGLVAAALQAISPLAIAGSCRILSDSLYALLLTGALLLVVLYFKRGRLVWLLAGAVVTAAACYVRPAGLAPAILIAAVILVRPGGWWRAPLLASVVAVMLAPWVVRNARVADFGGLSSFATDSLYRFSAAEIEARRSDQPIETMRRDMDDAVEQLSPDSPGAAARYRQQRAMEIISQDQRLYARVHLAGSTASLLPGATDVLEVAGATVGQRGTLAVLHRDGLWAALEHYFGGQGATAWLAAPMVLIWLVRMLGAVLGGLCKVRLKMSASAWLMLLMVCAALLTGGPAATPRFRLPVEPIWSVGAAYGLMALVNWLRACRGRTVG